MQKKNEKGWHNRGYLPHFDSSQVIQSITYRLGDSLPVAVVRQIISDRTLNTDSKRKRRLDEILDSGFGACYLKNPEIARLVEENWRFFDGKKYDLIAWVIMPNHVHLVIKPYPNNSLSKIIHSWKSYTASKCNKILNRNVAFWYPDYWDRYIRNEKHLYDVIEYIRNNPVKAGLVDRPEDWSFISALEKTQRITDSLVRFVR